MYFKHTLTHTRGPGDFCPKSDECFDQDCSLNRPKNVKSEQGTLSLFLKSKFFTCVDSQRYGRHSKVYDLCTDITKDTDQFLIDIHIVKDDLSHFCPDVHETWHFILQITDLKTGAEWRKKKLYTSAISISLRPNAARETSITKPMRIAKPFKGS